jgi:hypothetical protein
MRGKKPTATVLHIARGNPSGFSKRELREPTPVADLTADGSNVARLSPAQRLLFAELLAAMPKGVLKATDFTGVAILAIALDRCLAANERITNDSLVVKSPGGPGPQYRTNPFLRVWRDTAELALRAAGEVGATPIVRARMRGMGTGEPSPSDSSGWDAFVGKLD